MFLTRIGYGIAYFVVLIYEVIKATIDVASISLTPGTLSVDLDSENNIIKVAAISPRSKEDIIPFEPYIKKMLE